MISDEQVWDTIFGDDIYVNTQMNEADEEADDALLWVLEYFNARAHTPAGTCPEQDRRYPRDTDQLINDWQRLMEKLRWKR